MFDAFNLKRFNLLHGDASVRNTPVIFNGLSIADVVPRANVLDVRIGAAGIDNTVFVSGNRSGSQFVRNRHTTRPVEVVIEMPLDRETYAENMNLIRAWAYSDEPKELILSEYHDRKLYATCKSIDEFSVKEWWMPVTIEFEAWKPYFISKSPKTANVGESFTVKGDVPPIVTVTHDVKSLLTAPQWTVDGTKYIKFKADRSFSNGKITIDYDNASVIYNEQSAMTGITLTSRFAEIGIGNHIIEGPQGGIVTWYERWL